MHVVSAYRQRVPAADVVVLEGVGHYAGLEDPDATWTAIETFYNNVVPPGTVLSSARP
jgi:pimeloyl-ACP methyl ester carboxylesterase